MIGINCYGNQGELYYSGNSSAVMPNGEVLFDITDKEEMRIFELTDDVPLYRKQFPTKADRRPELYKEFYAGVYS